jgi:hypothetical protein
VKLNDQLRADVEFYRAKVERLELALNANPAAQAEYAERTKVPVSSATTSTNIEIPRRVPFRELQRRWMSLSEAEQNMAIESGSWDAEPKKEETHAGE